MPCPPSYEELRFIQLDHDTAVSATSLTRQLTEIQETNALIVQIEGLVADEKTVEKLEVFRKQLEELAETGSKISLSFDYPTTWPEMEDVHRYEAFAENLQRADQAIEFRLCETRTFLYFHQQTLILPNVADHPTLAEAWLREVERHRLHREADRAAAIHRLEYDLNYYKNRLQLDLSPTQRESAQSYWEEFTRKIQAVNAIPIEVLMADRSIF